MVLFFSRFLVGMALLGSALDAQAQSFDRYVNARFGTGLDLPSAWLPDPEAANGDGRIFRSQTGEAWVAIWGAHISGTVEDEIRNRSRTSGAEIVTFRRATARRLTVSGFRNGRIFYSAGMAGCDGSIWGGFDIEYPRSERARFDALVNRMHQSLAISQASMECER